MKSCFLSFCLFYYLAGTDRDGWTPETAMDFVTFGKSNAKALLTAGVYQKFPCALPGAEKSKGALSEFWDRAHLYTTPPGIVFSCRSGKLQEGQNRESGFSRFAGNSKPVQVCPACEVVNRVAGSYPQVDTPGETGQDSRRIYKTLFQNTPEPPKIHFKGVKVYLIG